MPHGSPGRATPKMGLQGLTSSLMLSENAPEAIYGTMPPTERLAKYPLWQTGLAFLHFAPGGGHASEFRPGSSTRRWTTQRSVNCSG